MQWSAEPALLTVFGFGKHRGERFDAAPRDYLEWIASGQNDLREDVKFSARYWLQRMPIDSDRRTAETEHGRSRPNYLWSCGRVGLNDRARDTQNVGAGADVGT